MSGSRIGGLKARDKNLARDPDFYKRIGALGGSRGRTGGFASYSHCDCKVIKGTHYKQQCAGKLGGKASKRGPKKEAA